MSQTFRSDVFLSHNSKDKPAVRRLAERLRAAGLGVWFDEWAIKAGDDIYLAIEHGLEDARVQILCLSPAALGSNWVALERSTVLFRDPTNAQRRFVPLLLADCDLPDTLRRYKYVDYRDESDSAFEELLTACAGRDGTPAEPGERVDRRESPEQLPRPVDRQEGRDSFAEEYDSPELVLDASDAQWIDTIVASPDDSWAAAACDDGSVRMWDLASGASLARMAGTVAHRRRLLVSADGKTLVSAGSDIVLWNASDGRELRRFTEHSGEIRGLAYLNEAGTLLISGSWDDTIKIWDLDRGICLKTITMHESGDDIFCIVRGRHDDEAISGHRHGSIRLWDLKSGQCTMTLAGHTDLVCDLRMLPDGRSAISASDDRTIRTWDLESGGCIATIEGHGSSITNLVLAPDGNTVATTGFSDHTVRITDWRSGTIAVIRVPRSTFSVAFTADGSRIIVGTTNEDGRINVYRIADLVRPSTADGTRRYVNAKVVLVGQPGVGKSALAHRLVEDRYVQTDSTHGMNVWQLDLQLADDGAMEREALLWDLAGQEDYRLIHQLYLPDTALALVLIHPQADDPFAEAADWVKALRAAANASGGSTPIPKVLVPARVDVGGMMVSQAKIDRFSEDYGFAACMVTSAKRGDNCSDSAEGGRPSALKRLIEETIVWDGLPWTATPRLLSALKDAVISLESHEDIRLIRFAELAQRLEQALPDEAFGDDDVRTAIGLLANHGLIKPLKFGDLILLRPEMLSSYAAAIIRAARAHKDEIGCVAEEDIFSEDFDLTGVERLPRADEELLLRGIIQIFLDHALCIREQEAGQTLLIFPSQYRRDREIPTHPNVFVTYTFTGELQTIYTTLVVRLWHGALFGHKELWRNAAEFATSKGDAAGLLFEGLGEGKGRLSIFFDAAVPDELKVLFIEFVHRHLHRYSQNLERERRYVCACGEAVTNMEAIEKRKAAGRTFITCQACDKRIPFKDHIEERLGSDSILRQVAALDRQATVALDNQAREQILVGHMMAICGEANQIFRETTRPDYGIDGEIEFRNNSGEASGKRIFVQLKSGPSYLRKRARDGREVFDVKHPRHLDYWVSQPVDVFLVIRDGEGVIRWMNLSHHLRTRSAKASRQIVFEGEKLDFEAVWRLRDQYIPR
jgi:GTPase SAR1 family protein